MKEKPSISTIHIARCSMDGKGNDIYVQVQTRSLFEILCASKDAVVLIESLAQ
jgi:hypothetical protein